MTLRYDIAQNYALKTAIEQLFGRKAWLDLKECTSLTTWRKYVIKVMDAIQISIEESIEIRDPKWMSDVKDNLSHGKKLAKSSKNPDDLFSAFTATLLRQVFIQIGFMPERTGKERITLQRECWRLNDVRSVQYIQSKKQIEASFWSQQQKEIGFDNQMELNREYRESMSKLPFSEWCQNRR
jgi:hypothetical protein